MNTSTAEWARQLGWGRPDRRMTTGGRHDLPAVAASDHQSAAGVMW